MNNAHLLEQQSQHYAPGGAPATVVATPSVGAVAGSNFLDNASGTYTWTVAGNYQYAVEAYAPGTVSLPVLSLVVALATGGDISIAIGASSGNTEAYYKVYRSRKGGTSDLTDFRYIGMIAKNPSGTTTFLDKNFYIAGSSTAVMQNPEVCVGSKCCRQRSYRSL